MLVLPSLRKRALLASLFRPPVIVVPTTAYGFSVGASGAGETVLPGTEGTNFKFPSAVELDVLQRMGAKAARVPIRWERIQPTLGGALDATHLGRMKDTAALIQARGMKAVWDLHNYGHRIVGGVQKPIGGSGSGVTFAHLNDVWGKLAAELKTLPATGWYELMNEPRNMGDNGISVPAMMQGAINAVAATDAATICLVSNDGYSSARFWKDQQNVAALAAVTHPGGKAKLLHVAHQYDDRANLLSGTYSPTSYDQQGEPNAFGTDGQPTSYGPATATEYAARMAPFLEWLTQYDLRGAVTEFGVPDGDARWVVAARNAVQALVNSGRIDLITMWSVSEFFGANYALQLYPRADGYDRLPAEVITERTGGTFNRPPSTTGNYRVTSSGDPRITSSGEPRTLETV